MVVDDYLFWVSGELATGGLGRVRIDGTEMTPLFTDKTEGISNDLIGGSPLAANSRHVYWSRGRADRTDPSGGMQEILRMPLSGGPPQLVIDQQNGVASIVLSDKHVYWATTVAERIWRLPLDEIE